MEDSQSQREPTLEERWERLLAFNRDERRERIREVLRHPIECFKEKFGYDPGEISEYEREWILSHLGHMRGVILGLRRLTWLLGALAFIVTFPYYSRHLDSAIAFGILAAVIAFVFGRMAIWVVRGFYFPFHD